MALPGRNEPCPCGSGRKYKRCCLTGDEERDRARRASADERDNAFDEAASDGDVGEALEVTFRAVAGHDSAGVSKLLDRFGDLVMSGQRLDSLRFDDEAFRPAVERALPSLGRARAARKRERLFELAVPELAERRVLLRFRAQLERAAQAAVLQADDRAGVVAALMCLAPTIDRSVPPADSPTLEIIFNVQLEEWIHRHEALRRVLDDAGQRLRSGDIGLDEMETIVKRALADDPAGVAALVDASGAAEALDRSMDRVLRTLRARRAPALFTAAETIFLVHATRVELASLYRVEAGSADPEKEAAQALLEKLRQVFDRALADEITRRIIADRVRGHSDPSSRFLHDFVGALTADPAYVGPLAFLTTLGRAAVRDELEQEHVDRLARLERWNSPDLASYGAYLQAAGDAIGARLVRLVLDDLPPDGLMGGLFALKRRARRSRAPGARANTQLDLLDDAERRRQAAKPVEGIGERGR